MTRVFVMTESEYLGQKIKLALSGRCAVDFGEAPAREYDFCLWDIDFKEAPLFENIITMSRELSCDLSLPFTYEKLFSLFEEEASLLSLDGRICHLRGEKIKLTELEASLLSLLISAGGEYVSRDEILSRIWGNDADRGIINVYIHYLREKLEQGEKIILSSRNEGYRIDKKYLGGKNAHNN